VVKSSETESQIATFLRQVTGSPAGDETFITAETGRPIRGWQQYEGQDMPSRLPKQGATAARIGAVRVLWGMWCKVEGVEERA